jgi:hypothetical protein
MLPLSAGELSTLAVTGSGQFSDGVLEITVSEFNGSTFSWKSNIAIDCIFASTAGGGEFLTFDPESLGEDNITIEGSIVHLSFCYDLVPAATSTPTPTLPDEPTPTPAATGTPGESLPQTSVSRTDPTSGSRGSALVLALLTIVGLAAALWFGAISRGRRRHMEPALASAPWSTQVATSWSVPAAPSIGRPDSGWHWRPSDSP